MIPVRAAFLALTDAAVLIAAREKGFAEAEGIDLTLVRDTSWATLRDRLIYGDVQAAHMLAPMAVAVSLGLGQHAAVLSAPYKLNVNGNLLVMASEFTAALEQNLAARLNDPLATAHDFAAAIGLYRRKPVIGVVHRHSSHALMLRYWLASAGVDPDRDVVLRVVPPSLMAEAMALGETDGFIAGEPWGSVAIEAGVAEAVAAGERIWRRGVEKTLTFRTDWMERNTETVDRLLRAVARAATWCDDPANADPLVDLLSRSNYIDQPAELIARGLTGTIVPRRGSVAVRMDDFVLFAREATGFPWRSQALWIYSQLLRWQMIEPSSENERRAAAVFRPDVYRRALSGLDLAMPGASSKVEGALDAPMPIGTYRGEVTLGPDRFFDGRRFDPEDVAGYVAQFER